MYTTKSKMLQRTKLTAGKKFAAGERTPKRSQAKPGENA
jgi:hypothetical protein